MTATAPSLPMTTRLAILVRLFAIQGAWNYETLVGNGIGFCVEPALRLLPGGVDGPAYKAALARQSQYFNTHPYTASYAVGALARVELEQQEPAQIERFRTALCGPLGATGDRLVWAAWLPFSVLVGLLVFGLNGSALASVGTFLAVYNAGHLTLRLWGVRVGFAEGRNVARALGVPLFRAGPQWVSRVGAALAGVAIPLSAVRTLAPQGNRTLALGVLVAVALGGLGLARVHGRYDVWKWALGFLVLFVLIAMVRS